MSAATSLSPGEPVLRTLAPALGELEGGLRTWLAARHPDPPSTLLKAQLTGLADDLARQADALKLDQPLLVVILMGGTGVGKSSLLNALAGAPIANASFARPTTRDPVVYLHEGIDAKRLDPALQLCKLASHDRPALRHKILVDTPDIDSNDLANREKLFRILPVADVVLYVGSQEKYHDQLGWDLFLEQKRRRAFAFVLNKWDRCQIPGAGARPDEDWIRDLQASGFPNPLLFRTCAQYWIDHPWQNVAEVPPPPVPGEQFLDLTRWLEEGLSRLEIEAIKARGVGQLLDQLAEAVKTVCPPDLSQQVTTIAPSWAALIHQEADESAGLLLTSLDPYQVDIERHFAERRRHLFTGLMAWYLGIVHKVRSLATGGGWKPKMSWTPSLPTTGAAPKTVDFNLAAFLGKCSQEASERHLQSRTKAFANRLLLAAESHGLPARLLTDRVDAATHHEWNARHAQAMLEVLTDVERSWAEPSGPRQWVQRVLVLLGNTLPSLSLLAMTVLLLWRYFYERQTFDRGDIVLPIAVMILTMVTLHILIAVLIPMRWPTLRTQFHRKLLDRLDSELTAAFAALPRELADDLNADRERVEQYLGEVRAISSWLREREQAASVGQLFG
jgi:energy-coupling factor transporter ATP-binding protein EcfA2